ncbi:EamA family transporter [Methylocapsa palsarum]|uniref:O-acetylserine/cysteine efflux transporter n=1 Tax=Methylocapsa palsarum TaxID=1612308 RepID=A0A1I3XR81_9HYPH|nr:EamA family transporter [Methylocapsa palsarum]SFK22025.1 O-acetylserine/cysteine efflux transporter [Methylocapsa palsarum]
MRPLDILSALIAALALGLAFIAIKIGVAEAPPMLLTALRFTFAAFPAVCFVSPPKARISIVALYGLLIGVGQFGLLFLAIGRGMPVGLASLVIQLQAFVTVLLAWAALGERPSAVQVTAAAVALAGIALIGSARLGSASLGPFLMVVAASLCWGVGNLVGKIAGRIDMFAFTIWSSLASPLPLLGLSLWVDGRDGLHALTHPTLVLALCVAGLAYGGTLIGFGLWSRLLSHYPAGQIAPFALLIPVIGMIAGRIVFLEPLSRIEMAGALLVMAGLTFNVFGERLLARRIRQIP